MRLGTCTSRDREHAIFPSSLSLVLVLLKYDGIYLQFLYLQLADYRDRDTLPSGDGMLLGSVSQYSYGFPNNVTNKSRV